MISQDLLDLNMAIIPMVTPSPPKSQILIVKCMEITEKLHCENACCLLLVLSHSYPKLELFLVAPSYPKKVGQNVH